MKITRKELAAVRRAFRAAVKARVLVPNEALTGSPLTDRRVMVLLKELRDARNALNLSCHNAAPFIDLSPSTLAKIELGKVPLTVDRMLEFCDLYGVQPWRLFRG